MSYKLFIFSIFLAVDLAIGVSLWRFGVFENSGLELHVLDVEQGDAILLRTEEGHNILVDGGPGNAVLLELAEELPYLFSEIDLLVLTHPHADHMEGLIYVLDRFDVQAVLMSAPDYSSLGYDTFLERLGELQTDGLKVYLADDDMDFRFGETKLDVIYPFEPVTGTEMKNVNNASPVIMVEWRDVRILLSGDAEIEVEERLVAAAERGEVDLKADVLKAGHHGSKTASGLPFLKAVDPDVMVISLGEGNSFGHPHEETLEKTADLGIEVLRTDLSGRVSLYFCTERSEFFFESFVAAVDVKNVCDGTFTVGD